MSKIPKFCWGCGNQLKDNQKFCTRCGKPVKVKDGSNSPKKTTNTPVKTTSTNPYRKPTTPTPPVRKDYQKEYTSLRSQQDQTQKITPPPQEPVVTAPTPVQPLPATPVRISEEDLSEVRSLNQTITDLDLEKRFKTIEYKINALNVENELLDLENKVDELHLNMKPPEFKIPDNLATKEDLEAITSKINEIDLTKLNQMDKLSKLDDLSQLDNLSKLDQIDELSQKLKSLDQKMANLESAEKISNLAKNTVTRLNKMEKRLNEFNIENRQRLVKLDERVEDMTQKMDHVNTAVDAILPEPKADKKADKPKVEPST